MLERDRQQSAEQSQRDLVQGDELRAPPVEPVRAPGFFELKTEERGGAFAIVGRIEFHLAVTEAGEGECRGLGSPGEETTDERLSPLSPAWKRAMLPSPLLADHQVIEPVSRERHSEGRRWDRCLRWRSSASWAELVPSPEINVRSLEPELTVTRSRPEPPVKFPTKS